MATLEMIIIKYGELEIEFFSRGIRLCELIRNEFITKNQGFILSTNMFVKLL